MKLILVESYNEKIKDYISHDSDVVPLNPTASCELEKARIVHRSLSRHDHLEWDDNFHEWLETWLKLFEFHHFNRSNIAHDCYAIISGIIYNFVEKGLVYHKLMNNKKYDDFLYCGYEKQIIKVFEPALAFKGTGLLFNFFCEPEDGKEKFVFRADNELFDRLTPRFRDRAYIRPVLDYIRCLRFLPAYRKKKILFANCIPSEIRDAKLKGYHVDVLKNFGYMSKVDPGLKGGIHYSLYKNIEDKFGIPIHTCNFVLDDILTYFTYQYIPMVGTYEEYFDKMFRCKKYDCVVFRHRSDHYHFAAFRAAKTLKIPTVYLHHGWDAYNFPFVYKERRGVYEHEVCLTKDYKEFVISKGAKHNVI